MRIYQLVDLRSLKIDEDDKDSTLELSARYLDGRHKAGDPWRFLMRLYVFSGSPDAVFSGTPDTIGTAWHQIRNEALSLSGRFHESNGGTPQLWQEVKAKALLPPNADFALVHLAIFSPGRSRGPSTEFDRQFVDDVRLMLQTQPELSTKVTQR